MDKDSQDLKKLDTGLFC